jgi:F420-dependent oxidoreductase-like protein
MATYGLQLPDFGWITSSLGEDPTSAMSRLRDLAVAADESGYTSLWVMDHFFQLPPLGGPKQPILEGYVTLGALAAVTKHVQLGTLVTGVTYRNPGVLAKMITTLDILSAGRAILGIGAAWYDVEHTGLGVEFPALKQRYEMLEEAVTICRLMFTEAKPSFSGKHFSITDAYNVPGPVRAGGIPIMIGGSGPQKTLGMVGRLADQCNITGDAEMIAELNGLLDGHCRAAGRDPKDVLRTRMGSLFLCDDQAQADALKGMFNFDANPDARRQFTIGTPDQVVAEVRALAAVGVDHFIFNLPGITDPAVVAKAGDILREAVGS